MSMYWIYEIEHDNSARYVLGQIFDHNATTLICFGLNPSTASPSNLDNTILKIKKIATNNGYKNWIMLNIYPQRFTNPQLIDVVENRQISYKNLLYIQKILLNFCNADILLAYGNLINKRAYFKRCLSEIIALLKPSFVDRIYILKQTKLGNPTHPLYQPNNSSLKKFSLATLNV